MTWYSSLLEADPVAIKAYLDGLSITTINALAITEVGSSQIMIVVEGT